MGVDGKTGKGTQADFDAAANQSAASPNEAAVAGSKTKTKTKQNKKIVGVATSRKADVISSEENSSTQLETNVQVQEDLKQSASVEETRSTRPVRNCTKNKYPPSSPSASDDGKGKKKGKGKRTYTKKSKVKESAAPPEEEQAKTPILIGLDIVPNLNFDTYSQEDPINNQKADEVLEKIGACSNLVNKYAEQNHEDNSHIAIKFNGFAKEVTQFGIDLTRITNGMKARDIKITNSFTVCQKLINDNAIAIEKNTREISKLERKATSHTNYRLRQLQMDIAEREKSDKELIFRKVDKDNVLKEAERELEMKLNPKDTRHMGRFGHFLVVNYLEIFNSNEFKLRHVNGGYWLSTQNPDGTYKFVLQVVEGYRDQILNELYYNGDDIEKISLEDVGISRSQRDRNLFKKNWSDAKKLDKQIPGSDHTVQVQGPGLFRVYNKNKNQEKQSPAPGQGSGSNSENSESRETGETREPNDPAVNPDERNEEEEGVGEPEKSSNSGPSPNPNPEPSIETAAAASLASSLAKAVVDDIGNFETKEVAEEPAQDSEGNDPNID